MYEIKKMKNQVLGLMINRLVLDQVYDWDVLNRELKQTTFKNDIKRYHAHKQLELINERTKKLNEDNAKL